MFLRPDSVLTAFGVNHGAHVADFGSGSGEYALRLANHVGPRGRVYAIDINPMMLERLKYLSDIEKRNNIDIIRADLEMLNGTYLSDEMMDAGVASNILFQVEERGPFIAEMRRHLKPRARLLLVDWSDSFGNMGPHPEAVVPEMNARRMFEHSGFGFLRSLPAGDHHYALVFEKQ